jgi:alcohol dehydrogenase (NADP+)
MKYIELNTSASMPMIGLGTWKAAAGESYQAIRWAVKLGYTHFDCADFYGNQAEIGQAFHDVFAEDHIRREDLFITSKLWNDAHDPEDVEPALRRILTDLQLPYLDLFLMHWPVAQKKGVILPHSADDMIDLQTLPLERTWEAMAKMSDKGLVKAVGVANFGVENLRKLIDHTDTVPAVDQIECHPYLQQNDPVDFCRKNMIAVTAYSPLGTAATDDRPNLLADPVVTEIASRLGVTAAQVILSRQLARGLCVIPKSVHEKYLRENMAALNIVLDAEDMKRLDALERGYRFVDGSAFAFGPYAESNIFA